MGTPAARSSWLQPQWSPDRRCCGTGVDVVGARLAMTVECGVARWSPGLVCGSHPSRQEEIMTAERRSWVADPDRIVVAGPLARYVCGFRTEAVRLGFVQSSVASQLQMMARLSQWLADAGLDPAQATPEVVQGFVQARRRRGYTDAVSRQGLGPLLSYLRSRSIIPPALQPAVDTPVETLLAQFGNYLVRERGLAAKTVRQYVDHSRIFLRSLPDPLTEALAGLTASQVTEF